MSARRSSHTRRSSRAAGFTLIEVMVSVSILAMVTALTWSSFHQTMQSKRIVEESSQRYHSVRLALERITRELEMAYVSMNEDMGQQEKRTFFIGKRRGDIDELRFSMFGHQRLYADANEADTSQVAYYGVPSRDDPGRLNLVRRETRRLNNLKMEQAPGRSDVLCEDVVRLQFDYYDGRDKQLREEWSTLAADGQPDRLPSWVKISLTVRDAHGNDLLFTTKVRLPMQEPLNLLPRS